MRSAQNRPVHPDWVPRRDRSRTTRKTSTFEPRMKSTGSGQYTPRRQPNWSGLRPPNIMTRIARCAWLVLSIEAVVLRAQGEPAAIATRLDRIVRSEEHTSELQS